MTDSRVLIWGAGAIGGTIGAYLVRSGVQVLFVDSSAEHVARIDAEGLAISGPIAEFSVSARACEPEQVSGVFQRVFLCVKAQDTAAALERLTPLVASNGCVVSLQNGLNEKLIAARLGADRTIGAFVNFGADYIAPGTIHYGGRGAVVVGELDGSLTARIREIHTLLTLFDDRAVLTQNIWGFLWSKLAYVGMLFATALTNESIADCLDDPALRPVFIALAREIVSVAVATDIRLEPFDGFDPRAYLPGADAAAMASVDALVAHNRRSAKTHSGIWRDLAVRKRVTEVDAQLGAVALEGSRIGLPVPLTQRTIELIHDIEQGRRVQSRETLQELNSVASEARAARANPL